MSSSVYIKEFVAKENIEFHLTNPNSHIGNSDAERLIGNITEKLRILNLEQQNTIRMQTLNAIKTYNN